MSHTPAIVAMLAGLALTGAAQAGAVEIGSIDIHGQGAPITLDAGSMPTLFDGPFNNHFTDEALNPVHEMLHADGIVTDGMVTFLFLDTADGLSFLTLIDDSTGEVIQGNTELALSTSGPATGNYWVNDPGDLDQIAEAEGGIFVNASFKWNDGKGDAFAWSNLQGGDELDFKFNKMGEAVALNTESPYQFVTAGEEGWETVRFGDYTEGDFEFNFAVPLPAPGAFVLLSLAGLIGAPRRRRA